jgi:hypothetical protein
VSDKRIAAMQGRNACTGNIHDPAVADGNKTLIRFVHVYERIKTYDERRKITLFGDGKCARKCVKGCFDVSIKVIVGASETGSDLAGDTCIYSDGS